MRLLCWSCWFAALLVPATLRADWPQFRGPDGQGHSSERGLPLRWSEAENVRWKVPIPGHGWSSPVVLGGQVWVTTGVDDGRSLRAICVDAGTGRLARDVEIFRIATPPKINAKNSYASPTPVLEPGRLYAHFGTFGTACLDTHTGKILWTNDELKLDHKEGPGSSPVLCGDRLILTCDGMDVQYLVALDKQTGRIIWKTPRSAKKNPNPDLRKAYSTPLIVKVDGRDQIISPGADRASAYDAETGTEIWWVDYRGFSNVPRPVSGQGLLFLCTGYTRPEMWALRLGAKGQLAADQVIWRETKQVGANPSPLLVEDQLYTVSDGGIFTARSATTGRELWNARLGAPVSSSPVFADGRIYVCDESGKTSVLKPGTRFERLAHNALSGRMQASPAISDRAIFLRTEEHLYRLEEMEK